MVEPEWLDRLAPEDARARRSRRDLIRLNGWMGNARLIARALRKGLPEGPASLADLGCGDGTAMLAVARRIACPGASVTLVDRQHAITQSTISAFGALGWSVQCAAVDVFDWLADAPPFSAVTANLFLHHFESPALERMLSMIAQKTRFFAACEPRRSRLGCWVAGRLGIFGASEVTRNDAPISVRAGFKGRELTGLWPAGRWDCREGACGIFSHLFVAHSKDA